MKSDFTVNPTDQLLPLARILAHFPITQQCNSLLKGIFSLSYFEAMSCDSLSR